MREIASGVSAAGTLALAQHFFALGSEQRLDLATLCNFGGARFDTSSFLAGLVCGVILFALVEAFVTLRWAFIQVINNQAASSSRSSWMSIEAEVEELRVALAEVREEVSFLKAEVERLRRSIAGLRATGGAAPPQSPPRGSSYAASEDSYSVLSEGRATTGASRLASRAAAPPSPISSEQSGPYRGGGGSQAISWQEREEIATNLGLWVARSVRGEHRGASGRDRNPLSSRVWITVRDFQGLIYDPPLIHRTWQGCKVLCKRGSEAGDSVFFGLPTQQEARRAVEAAGLVWSGVLQQ